MPKALREAYLASLGIIALSYNKARKLSIELIKKGELAKEKQQKFITDLLEQSRKNTAEISEIIDKKVEYLAEKGEPLKEKKAELVKDLHNKAKKTKATAEEKIKEVVKQVVAKSKDIKDKPQKIIEGLKEKAARSDEEKIEELLEKLNIPTKEDLEEINFKLDELIKRLENEGNNNEHIQ